MPMECVHVKDLEQYHPGYRDRSLIWGKIYFNILTKPELDNIPEIDLWRFISFILLELQLKKPIPLASRYYAMMRIDVRKRPISKTLQVLHSFIEVRNTELEKPVAQSRVEYIRKSRVEESRGRFTPPTLFEIKSFIQEEKSSVNAESFWNFYESKDWFVGRNKMKDWHKALAGWESRKGTKKTKLFPISGRMCSKESCRMPAVYKDSSGSYDRYCCSEHLPVDVKERYE